MPLPTTNLTVHWDASTTTHLKTTAGSLVSNSTGTPSDGDDVLVVQPETDSGVAAGLTERTSDSQAPTFRSGGSALMAHSCLDFDGSVDWIEAVGDNFAELGGRFNVLLTAAAHTILIAFYPEVISSTGHGENAGHMLFGDHTSGYYGLNLYDNSGTKKIYGYMYDGSDHFVEQPLTVGESHVVMWRHESGNQYLSVDGGSEVSGVCGTADSAILAQGVSAGGGPATTLYNGRIGEIAVYNAALTGSNLTNAINYFTQKWITGGGGSVMTPYYRLLNY